MKIAFQDPGRSTSLHSKIQSLQSRSDVRLRRDDFAATESVRLQETISTQLGHRRSDLEIVTRLAWEHIYSKCDYLRGRFLLYLYIYIYPVAMVNVGYHRGLSVIYHSLN